MNSSKIWDQLYETHTSDFILRWISVLVWYFRLVNEMGDRYYQSCVSYILIPRRCYIVGADIYVHPHGTNNSQRPTPYSSGILDFSMDNGKSSHFL